MNKHTGLMKKLLSAALIALLALQAFALQVVDIADGRSHQVTISKSEMTRIAVEGGKIRRLDFVDGELEVKKDDEAGDYYIMPLAEKAAINVFVKSASGQTHALILQPQEMPLETIILREPVRKENDPKRTNVAIERAGSLEVAVKRLLIAMAKGDKPFEFDISNHNVEIGLWNEAKFVLVQRYSGRTLIGERFKLTNVSKTVMRLAEQELFKQGVVSVSIESMVLNPGESTDVFITRMNNDG